MPAIVNRTCASRNLSSGLLIIDEGCLPVNGGQLGSGKFVRKGVPPRLRFSHRFRTPLRINRSKASRGDRIRTCDLVLPKHPRYQTAPRPVTST